MKVYSKICKAHPKIKSLAAWIIVNAAYHGVSIMELQYAAEIALSAYKETAVVSASCVELQSTAMSILNDI